ncbi:MAG: DUF488 domain-containing protein [Candidatus Omnitrophica bacterium]|nr:DUF488 domain-containing protein [Candidatus Omnitrophota bacterium]
MHIYTLGYSGRLEEEFIRLLLEHGIKNVIDIRRNPTCQVEYFDKKHLETKLSTRNIKYFYLGKELGDFQNGNYQSFVQTTNFKISLIRLKEIAVGDVTAIICFEKHPSQCHRRFIASALENEGWRVIHIID